jgi:acetyl-CoA carboxylase alpha subunit
MAQALKDSIGRHLQELESTEVETLLRSRYEKFRKIGMYLETGSA